VNPNADWWQVMISGDGTNWVYVENTPTSEHAWRRNVIRVQDYITPSNTVQLKFIASDSIRPTVSQNGGSLVEAALDDFMLWDEINVNGLENIENPIFTIFPNPSEGIFTISWNNPDFISGTISVFDVTGRAMISMPVNGAKSISLDLTQFSSGIYFVRFENEFYQVGGNLLLEK
jgi:hypothetical protein